MSVKRSLSRLKSLATKSIIPKEFTDMIREDDTLFWSKPAGTSLDFHRAFHSKRTNPAIRYAMVLSGVLGDQNVVNRSLAGLRTKLHYKVEPQYSRSKGRLRLSHFELKGYHPSGRAQYLDMTPTARKMIMGTPIDPYLVRFGVAAMAEDEVLANRTRLEKIRITRFSNTLAKYHSKKAPAFKLKPLKVRPPMKESKRVSLAASSKLRFQRAVAERRLGKSAVASAKVKQPVEEQTPEEQPEEKQALPPLALLKPEPKKRKRSKKPTRKLTAAEKKRILVFFIELMKHLQGIMWILHYTIKLNDKRKKFLYIDENHKWVGHPKEILLHLYGFPEHLYHYIIQHYGFREWFRFIQVFDKSEKLVSEMNDVHSFAYNIDDKTYPNEETMQNLLDTLLDMCSRLLNSTVKFYEMVSKMDWIFLIEVVSRGFVLPPAPPKHTRHTKKNKVFVPETDPKEIKSKVGYYKFIHGNYWRRNEI